MLNTNLLPDDDMKPDVRFRIIGRHALPQSSEKSQPKPSMSWSVPFSWLFVMGRRIQKDKMEPMPIDVSNPEIMKNFHQG